MVSLYGGNIGFSRQTGYIFFENERVVSPKYTKPEHMPFNLFKTSHLVLEKMVSLYVLVGVAGEAHCSLSIIGKHRNYKSMVPIFEITYVKT